MPRLKIACITGTLAVTMATATLAPRFALALQPIRGDINSDGAINITDPIFLLNYLFSGGEAPQCIPAANANGDANVDLSDAITILTYLFVAPTVLPPLTTEELAQCQVTVVRHGRLQDVAEPSHGVDGNVEQLSDGTIRIESFNYDGLGLPKVVVLLTRNSGYDNVGFVISPDLVRDHPYVNETLEYPIPTDATNDDFKFVVIYCDKLPLAYGFAKLIDGP